MGLETRLDVDRRVELRIEAHVEHLLRDVFAYGAADDARVGAHAHAADLGRADRRAADELLGVVGHQPQRTRLGVDVSDDDCERALEGGVDVERSVDVERVVEVLRHLGEQREGARDIGRIDRSAPGFRVHALEF